MISSISCRNFRALEDVDVSLSDVTAFVGPNGSGKTSLLKSIDLVAGAIWPSLRSIRIPQDFTGFDANQEIFISLAFDPPLEQPDVFDKIHRVYGLRVRCGPYKRSGKWGKAGDIHFDFEPVNRKGEVPMVPTSRGRGGSSTLRPMNVSTGLRDQSRVLFIDHRRSVIQHLPSVRGSILGRLLEPARKEFEMSQGSEEAPKDAFRRRYESAMDSLRIGTVQEIESTIEDTAKRMLGFVGRRQVRDLHIGFGFADPANPFSSLRIVYREGDLELPAEELGLGLQSALVVGVFEAARLLGGDVGTIVIEEPEMYLHPQAQRYFYKLLVDLAEDEESQIIYSTHSPIFADAVRFETIRLVTRSPGKSSQVSWVSEPSDVEYLAERRETERLRVAFDSSRSEAFFARRVLLVEGPGDQLAVRVVADALKFNLDAEDLAVISCGSKSAIPFFARVLRGLRIPFLTLHDEDVLPEEGTPQQILRRRNENKRAAKENQEIVDAVGDRTRVFVVKPSLEAILGVGRNAVDKPGRVAKKLRASALTELPQPLVDAVTKLVEDSENSD